MGRFVESAFAVLTPAGRGGIAVIRCVGPAADAAIAQCFRPARSKKGAVPFLGLSEKGTAPFSADLPQPGQLAYGHITDNEGRPLDEVILHNAGTGAGRESPAASHVFSVSAGWHGHAPLRDRACREGAVSTAAAKAPLPCHPASAFTPNKYAASAAGSNAAGSIFEVNCHGGPAAVRAVCERLAAAGLREVDADRLMELEGLPRLVRDARRALRKAFTPLAAQILLDQLNGALAGAITEILASLVAGPADPYLAPGEHTGGRTFAGDPRAPPPVYSRGAKYSTAADALAAIDALLGRWRTCGRFLADPPRIVIAGRPNAGKSTLLNRLVGAERAITSAAPGTTRDYVEAEAALEGAPVILVDTAGLGEAQGEIERQGVERTRRELARAAAVVYLIDAAEGPTPEDEAVLASLGKRALGVLSKIDAAGTKAVRAPSVSSGARHRAGESAAMREGNPDLTVGARPLAISALTGEGAAALVAAVLEKVGWRAPGPGEAAPFTADHAEALAAARALLAAGRTDDAAEQLRTLLR